MVLNAELNSNLPYSFVVRYYRAIVNPDWCYSLEFHGIMLVWTA